LYSESNGRGAHEWAQVIGAVRHLLANCDDPSAAADYATRYGVVLLAIGQSGVLVPRQEDVLICDGEGWLGGVGRSETEIRARLAPQLRGYLEFPDLPPAVRLHFERLVRELTGPS
jgi:hypothetical protein